MKKVYTTPEYKAWQRTQIRKRNRPKAKRRSGAARRSTIATTRHWNSPVLNSTVEAPRDFRTLENTEACLLFFRNIRSDDFTSQVKSLRFVLMSLKHVELIDYCTISILTAISDDLKHKGILLKGDFPENLECKRFIIDSGFLNHMTNENGHRFPVAPQSDLIFFEKGCGVLSTAENQKISLLIKKVVKALTGEANYCQPIKTIILEICGNSIEWSGTSNKQWLLGVKYEEDRVLFTVTDVGQGILQTLHRRFTLRTWESLMGKTEADILLGAFDKKYGSSTQEENRNKGLPAVRNNYDRGLIQELSVLTNNVILHFHRAAESKELEKGTPRMKGTVFQWVMTKECLARLNSDLG